MDTKKIRLFAISFIVHLFLIYLLHSQILITKVSLDALEKPTLSAQLVTWTPRATKKNKPVASDTQPEITKVAPPKELEDLPAKEASHIDESQYIAEIKKPTNEVITDIEKVIKKPALSAGAILRTSKKYLSRQQAAPEPYNPSKRATTSLMTPSPQVHDYKPIYKSEEQKRQVKIHCDSGAKKALAAIAGLLRGTLACEKQPDLSSFLPKPKK